MGLPFFFNRWFVLLLLFCDRKKKKHLCIHSLNHQVKQAEEKVKENKEKIKLNKQLPYLVSNVVEILDPPKDDEEEQEDGTQFIFFLCFFFIFVFAFCFVCLDLFYFIFWVSFF